MGKSGLKGDVLCFLTTHLFKVETHHISVLCIKKQQRLSENNIFEMVLLKKRWYCAFSPTADVKGC